MKKFSGLSEFALWDARTAAINLDFNQTRIQANEFKIPKKVQEELNVKTFNLESSNIVNNCNSLKDGEYIGIRYLNKFETSDGNVIELNQTIKQSRGIAKRLPLVKVKISNGVLQVLENLKNYSMNGKNIKVTNRDLFEFNAWIKGKANIRPRLLFKFDSELEYQDFMMKYQDTKTFDNANPSSIEITEKDIQEYNIWVKNKSLTPSLRSTFNSDDDYTAFMNNKLGKSPNISTDPAIIGNYEKPHVTKSSEKYYDEPAKVIETETPKLNIGELIGTLTHASSYIHLMHYASYGQPDVHTALGDLYKDLADEVDTLAEVLLSVDPVTEFTNKIIPSENNPVKYIKSLIEYCETAQRQMTLSRNSSLIDDINNLLSQTLYKLTALARPYDSLRFGFPDGIKKFSSKSENITTEEGFREYAHNLMKTAHGDNYSEDTTNKVVDDLIKNNPDADYGELIGRLTSGLGSKTFADWSPDEPDFDEDWIATLIIMVTKDKEKIPFDIFDGTKYLNPGWQINDLIRSSSGKFINGHTRDITKRNLNEIKKFFPKLYRRIQSLGLLKDYQNRVNNKI